MHDRLIDVLSIYVYLHNNTYENKGVYNNYIIL